MAAPCDSKAAPKDCRRELRFDGPHEFQVSGPIALPSLGAATWFLGPGSAFDGGEPANKAGAGPDGAALQGWLLVTAAP